MTDTVRARLNHYQMLGVSPDASGDEIVRAFAREGSVLRPHAFGVLAELCVAYETLRDPIKRRAYDASIGLKREPKLQKLTAGARQALIAQGPVVAVPAGRQTPAKAAAPAAQPTFQRNPEPPTRPALPLGPGADQNITPEPRIGRSGPIYLPVEEELGVEARPIDWKRTGTILGSLVVAACAMGGMAGWWSSSGVSEAAQPENTVSVALPRAKPVQTSQVAEVAPAAATVSEAPSERPRPAVPAAAPIEPAALEPAMEAQPEPSPSDPSSESLATAEAPATTAPMPLPNQVIARTIHRIGYSCGSVASTVPAEGEAPGVFKVTCASGQSYQARPVNGRYHFRRWGKR